jgi:hypothetical protein
MRMKKLALAMAVSAVIASPTFAAAVAYNGTAKSGTSAAAGTSTVGTVNNGIQVAAGSTTKVWYVNTASGTGSNKTAPAIQLNVASNWAFDFSNLAAVTFTGDIVYGTYATQTSVTGLATVDGRYTINNALQSFNSSLGTTTWNAGTNTLTFTKAASGTNGGASVGTNSGGTCVNGATSALSTVCGNATAATPSWEGLTFSFVFSADKSTFAGALTGTDKSGSGLTANTTTINWQVSGAVPAPTVPVPAAAWLFGSGLLGLAGTARRRRSV